MAKARPSVQKRIKETKAHEKRMAKAARKAARDAAREASREERSSLEEGVDPDLVGLPVGPQAIPWHMQDHGYGIGPSED